MGMDGIVFALCNAGNREGAEEKDYLREIGAALETEFSGDVPHSIVHLQDIKAAPDWLASHPNLNGVVLIACEAGGDSSIILARDLSRKVLLPARTAIVSASPENHFKIALRHHKLDPASIDYIDCSELLSGRKTPLVNFVIHAVEKAAHGIGLCLPRRKYVLGAGVALPAPALGSAA